MMIYCINANNPTKGHYNKPQQKFSANNDKIYHPSNKAHKINPESSNKWDTTKTIITLLFGLTCLALGLLTKNNKYPEGLQGLFNKHLKK